MKNIMLKIFTLLILSFFVSCSSDSDSNNNDTASFTFDVDGETINANVTSAYMYQGAVGISAKMDDGNHYVSLSVATAQVGTYNITGNGNSSNMIPALLYKPNEDESFGYLADPNIAESGVLTITDIDTSNQTISGTFSFTGSFTFGSSSTVEIENGVFNNIPYSTDLPDGFSGGTANFDLDGQAFNPTGVVVNRTQIVTTDYISVRISKPGEPVFTVVFPTDASLDSHSVSSFGSYRVTANISPTEVVGPTSGSITITENDSENRSIVGSFEAVLDNNGNNLVITNGTFNITYED